MKIGLVINPLAGIGGSVALKGSDGELIVEQALALGAQPKAEVRAKTALSFITAENLQNDEISIYTAAGAMGENALNSLGLENEVIYNGEESSTALDTVACIRAFVKKAVDLIVFAGGDGTARDVLDALSEDKGQSVPVVGIPAGVKIHSAVYAITPTHAGELIQLLLANEPMSKLEAPVMDLDEDAFREGKVIAKCYGYLSVPVDDTRMQLIKQGGLNQYELAIQDIAAEVIENMLPDVYYLIGSGSTTAEIMNQLHLDNTLLGVDIICNESVIANDVNEQKILEIIKDKPAKMIVTVIGGQGHIFGRGNQQLSANVIKQVTEHSAELFDRDNIIIVASNEKLRSLDKRPMIADTGDSCLDRELRGLYSVITGYEQKTLYKLN